MTKRTDFPALRCKIGEWVYYITYMTFLDVKEWIQPTDQIHPSKMLRDMIQRELKPRASNIADYLVEQDERFFNSIVVGVYDGTPQWYPIEVQESPVLGEPNLDENARQSIGVLQFDGSEKLFAIDGQHRVQAIKEAIERKPEREKDELSVIFVAHQANEAGQRRTRRLFTTLNKWAVKVSKGEIIALDEDDAFAITTRRLVEDFPLLKSENRRDTRFVSFGVQPSLNSRDNRNLTVIRTIYEIAAIIYLPILKSSPHKKRAMSIDRRRRPSDEILDELYDELTKYWNLLVEYIPEYQELFDSEPDDEVAGKYRTNGGHFMFRPLGQQAFARATRIMMDRGYSMEKAVANLSQVPLSLNEPPWLGVHWDEHTNRIIRNIKQEFTEGILLYFVGQSPRKPSTNLLQLYRAYLGDNKAQLPQPVTGTLL